MHVATHEVLNTTHLEQLGRTIARSNAMQAVIRHAASAEVRSLDAAARWLLDRSATATKG